jgi:hypothetical protein
MVRMLNDKLANLWGDILSSNDIEKIIVAMEHSHSSDEMLKQLSQTNFKISESHILIGIKQNDSSAMTRIIKATYEDALRGIDQEIRITWENFEHNFNILLNARLKKDINIVIVDSELLIKNPEIVLQSITKKLSHITYCSEMLNNWVKGVGANFYCHLPSGDDQLSNAWVGPSRNSSGFTTLHDSTVIDLQEDQFPIILRSTISYATSLYDLCFQSNELNILLAAEQLNLVERTSTEEAKTSIRFNKFGKKLLNAITEQQNSFSLVPDPSGLAIKISLEQ